MLFRLASLLGKTVEALSNEMSEIEFAHWCKFYELEPWGCEAEDFRTALQTNHFVATQVKDPSKLKLRQFLPKWGIADKEPAWKSHKRIMGEALQALKASQEMKNVAKRR